MKNYIYKCIKHIIPFVVVLGIFLFLFVSFIPAHAATNVIKAGTYRFNDVLSNPNDVIGDGGSVTCFFQSNVNMQLTEEDAANLEVFASQYNISGPIPPAGSYHLVVSCYGFYTITDNNFSYLVNGATCEPYSEIFSAYVWALSSQGRYGVYYQDRWLDTQYQTITILEDTEVSAEFAEWFTANTVPVGSSPAPVEITLSVKDSSGAVLKSGSGLGPATVVVQDNGLIVYFDDGNFMTYIYSGAGHFAGVRTGSSQGTLYKPGDEFTLTESESLYVQTEYPKSGYQIYDYGSGALVDHFDHPLACIIYATDTGIEIRQYSTGVKLHSYAWDGEDAFAGFSLSPASYVQYEVGSYYISITDDINLYLYGADDISDDGSGDNSGDLPGGPGSSGDDLDGGGLNDAAGGLNQGNDDLGGSIGDMEDAKGDLPEISDDIQDLINGNLGSFNNSNIAELMPWNDPEYEDFWVVMMTPTITSVSVALLLYFVFGKARAG